MTGKFPNVSDKTGEPEYLDNADGPNKTRLMLGSYRASARVRTFDEAVARCSPGRNNVKVTVLNNPSDGFSLWVQDGKAKAFWMPKGHLSKH